MKRPLCLALVYFCICATVSAQSPAVAVPAGNPVQVSSGDSSAQTSLTVRELKIPAGTPVEIEAAYTVNSRDLHQNDLISFRILVPIKVDGITAIDKDALATGRIVHAKRGGHWGKAGKLAWAMQDVVAVDLTRVPLQAQLEGPEARARVTGTSHGGQIATEMIVYGSLLMFAAPLVLMNGFKRGEDAVLPEGKRFVVYVQTDTIIKAPAERAAQ